MSQLWELWGGKFDSLSALLSKLETLSAHAMAARRPVTGAKRDVQLLVWVWAP